MNPVISKSESSSVFVDALFSPIVCGVPGKIGSTCSDKVLTKYKVLFLPSSFGVISSIQLEFLSDLIAYLRCKNC